MNSKEGSVTSLLLSKEQASFARLPDEDNDYQHQIIYSHTLRSHWFLYVNVFLSIASVCCLVMSGVLYLKSRSDDSLLRHKTFHSSVAENFSPVWRPSTFKTHTLDSSDSIFRQDPSDAVDAAWERVHKIGVLAISSEDVRHLGKNPSTVVQPPESWNLGPDTHLAHLDGLHLIHCLNAMRKNLHQNFERYYPYGIPQAHHAHLSHCQEALVKHLMCQPSLELITYSWTQGRERPFPDFDITKKCYDFEQLLEWQGEHQVKNMSQEKWDELRKPEGITPLPVPILVLESSNMSRKHEEKLFHGPS